MKSLLQRLHLILEISLSQLALLKGGPVMQAGEYAGLNTSVFEPVLSVVGKMDPWFQSTYLKGDCGEFMFAKNGSRSIVYGESIKIPT